MFDYGKKRNANLPSPVATLWNKHYYVLKINAELFYIFKLDNFNAMNATIF
jgi:hypothetical protein